MALAFFLISPTLFSESSSQLQSAPVSSSQLQSAPVSSLIPEEKSVTSEEQSFIPEESRPDFSDFKKVLYFRMGDFERILPPFLSDSFETTLSGSAFSDHLITWQEIAFFLNYVATKVDSKLAKELYTGEALNYIKRTLKEEKGWFSSTWYYFYQAKEETADLPAKLPLTTLYRYTNWRDVHAWLYQQLKRYNESLSQGKLYDANDELAQYFKKCHLWPIVDVVGSTIDPSDEMSDYRTDNIDTILEEVTEVGVYWFGGDDTVYKTSQNPFYFLATLTEEEESSQENQDWNPQNWNAECYGFLIRSNSENPLAQPENDLDDYLTQQQEKIADAKNDYEREVVNVICLDLVAGVALGQGLKGLEYTADQKIAKAIENGNKVELWFVNQKRLLEEPRMKEAQELLERYRQNPIKANFLEHELQEMRLYEFYKIATGTSKKKLTVFNATESDIANMGTTMGATDVDTLLLTKQEKGYANWICHDTGKHKGGAEYIKERLTFSDPYHLDVKSKNYNLMFWH
ncbi:MAG: hypothetical protein K2W99_08300 [Chthoniobacterales bacterium]|nr:hypothetical protein [Chthoniobacterales bacterium]